VGDRLDEATGRVKEGVGKATDDERLQGEGRAQATAAKAGRKVKGTAKDAGGRIKEAAGKLVDDEGLEARGRADRLRGEAERLG
jgi:uncharacterized protein YjbJ (UPF0337 family)